MEVVCAVWSTRLESASGVNNKSIISTLPQRRLGCATSPSKVPGSVWIKSQSLSQPHARTLTQNTLWVSLLLHFNLLLTLAYGYIFLYISTIFYPTRTVSLLFIHFDLIVFLCFSLITCLTSRVISCIINAISSSSIKTTTPSSHKVLPLFKKSLNIYWNRYSKCINIKSAYLVSLFG
jgi:hypothetical protein